VAPADRIRFAYLLLFIPQGVRQPEVRLVFRSSC
jgi:hypothetical protein